MWYTVRNGAIEYLPLVTAELDNQNIYLDYDTVVSIVDSESDTIDYQRFDLLEEYLSWRIWCFKENNSVLDMNNGHYVKFREYLNDAIRTLPSKKVTTAPNLNHMSRGRRFYGKADPKLLSNSEL